MSDLIILSAFQTADIMFAWEENTIFLCYFTNCASIRLVLLSFSIGASLLTLIRYVPSELEMRTILQ